MPPKSDAYSSWHSSRKLAFCIFGGICGVGVVVCVLGEVGGGGGDMSIPKTLLIGNNIFNLKLLLHDSALESLRLWGVSFDPRARCAKAELVDACGDLYQVGRTNFVW